MSCNIGLPVFGEGNLGGCLLTTSRSLLMDGSRFGPETAVVQLVNGAGTVVAEQEVAINEAGGFSLHVEQIPAGTYRLRVVVKVAGFPGTGETPGEKRFENLGGVRVR